jgi:FlaA1/EpsC-like NDP-sugar epimerase
MFSTGCALVILAIYKAIAGEASISVNHIFQIFAAIILIDVSIAIRYYKIEIRSFILEHIIYVVYAILVFLIFGVIFNWYSTLPVWFFIVMTVVIDILSIIASNRKMRKDVNEINELLKKRRENNT